MDIIFINRLLQPPKSEIRIDGGQAVWDMAEKIRNPILEELFDNPVRPRLLKFFFNNADQAFSSRDIKRLLKIKSSLISRELVKFSSIGLLKSRVAAAKGGADRKMAGRSRKRNAVRVFFLNVQFYFYPELKSLVLKSSPISEKRLLAKIKRLGKIRLAAVSGVFVNADKSRADLLVVGDGISPRKADRFVEDMEAESGRTINFVILDTDEFRYRYGMFDRFLRDFFEYPHKMLINKLRL